MAKPNTTQDVIRLSAKAVTKIDLLGKRGTTLVTMDELEAMAVLIVMAGLLPPVAERKAAGAYPEFRAKGERS